MVVLFGTGMRRMVFSRWNHFCISILNFLIWIIMHLAFIGLDLLKKDSHNHSQIFVGLGLMVAFFISVGLYLSIPTQIVWIYYRMNRISDYNIMIGLKKEKRNNRSRTTLAVRERLRAESAANYQMKMALQLAYSFDFLSSQNTARRMCSYHNSLWRKDCFASSYSICLTPI